MALHLHRAEDTGALAAGLGALLAEPLADPFATELVLVSARGMERWLSQQLSHVLGNGQATDGVCAGIEFRSPTSLLAELSGTAETNPWDPDAMVWPLLEVLDHLGAGHTWAGTLAAHLGYTELGSPEETQLRQGRRYAVARRLAGLFDAYAKARPAMLADWLAGGSSDGAGSQLDDDLRWQPELWRATAARIDADPAPTRYAKTIARLLDSPSELPPRLSLFGHTRLPAADLDLLGALATHHDLHLWLPHPSDPLWRALSDLDGQESRRADSSRSRVDNPLLQTLGRDLRELQRGLPAAQSDQFHSRSGFPDTLLGWLQSDISANTVRPGTRHLKPDDRSVQIHRCHGAARQIDVLRDVLLGLLDDDETLQPRDILVMCPDIDTYAPLITAAFGAGEQADHSHPAQGLRVRLADRALTQTNPLLGGLSELLGIADGRATATAVLSLAHSEPVRRRFSFSDDDLVAITEWVGAAGIRWGFDAAHRAPFDLARYPQNTWQFGVDRLLVGAAMSDDSQDWLGTALPLDDVDSGRVELAGRLAEYVQRLRTVVDRLTGAEPLQRWVDVLRDAIALLTRVGSDEQWQQAQLDRELAKVLTHAGSRSATTLRLADVRALLKRQLAGRPTRANFRTGTLTVCTMVPMRSVPHRVVCLVGLDDGVFPRTNIADGDDVLARHPLTGERDIRSEDRQLLLDAICSAADTLVITYTGTDEHSGEHRPPAVPVQELLDAVDQTTAEPVRRRIVADHPLQPFDIRTVSTAPDGLVPDQPFTYDPAALRGAKAVLGERKPKPRLIDGPLDALPSGDVELTDLLRFFANPVRGFFRALDYTLPWDADELSDAMPVAIDGLGRWAVGERMLDDLMAGRVPDFVLGAEWRRGTLPPGRLGWRQAIEIGGEANELAAAARTLQRGDSSALDIDVDLGGRRLTGTITPLWQNRAVTVTYSKLAAKHRLQAWVTLVALTAGAPEGDWEAYCIGRGPRDAVHALGYRAPEQPLSVLRELVAIYDAGRREPLPLPLKTSLEWARARQFDDPVPEKGAESEWKWERDSAEYLEVWGPAAPLSVLLDPLRPDDIAVPGETTRLGAYATRLWTPLLDAERRC
ncbi:exodeoxyribonuclease V subunit gamma [Mycobacterium sp. CBMA 234]|uniref:exodeoxyribonuclease V subunit gamma n=1 Tax=Mycolicibacterium sp. CBMA 234 TaxID=1918495 RepID=UPI0012DE4CCF|nr:exodeoxyribonuclease V subunit gamma [Mycolicibacterium sp. CBMA 234]MUL66636.1 exodeoxyribonuclease V subunit gamma [Mycolicibacterium sp. CBMA 234]